MPGWFPAGADSWPLVVEVLQERGEPWPHELMLDDLAWWADREKMGRGRRPGRPTLAKRWGVTDHAAKKALRDPAWRNRQRQPVTSESPAGHQPVTSESPAPARANADNWPEVTSESPAGHQPVTSESPHARSKTPVTHTHTEQEQQSADEQPPTWAATKREAAERVYQAWRKHHARAAAVMTKPRRQRIVKCLEMAAQEAKGTEARYTADHWQTAEADLCDLVEWFHVAPEAKWWQGANPDGRKYLKVDNVFRYQVLSDRLESMREWRANGREVSEQLGLTDYTAEAESVWAAIRTLLPRYGRRITDKPIDDDPAKDAAAKDAIRAIGGARRLGEAREYVAEQQLRPRFAEAYASARRNGTPHEEAR